MINDHTLCYGHPWSVMCNKCARNITDRIKNIDESVFSIIPITPMDVKKGECSYYVKKLFKRK